MRADIVVVGGGIGGTMAALSAAKMGKTVILTEETDWIGGQLTSQAVPPDEHPWIEEFGCTDTYRQFRNRVRQYYKDHYPVQDKARTDQRFNPGSAWVSRIAHEPKVAKRVLEDMLQPFLSNGQITLLYSYRPVAVEVEEDRITHVTVARGDERKQLVGNYVLDATECGDLLPLAKAEYRIGAESKEMTGEPHALDEYRPGDVQSFTYVFALEYDPDGDYTIEKPDMYAHWRAYQADFLEHLQLSWDIPDADTGKSKRFRMFNDEGDLGLWEYRRIIDPSHFKEGFFKGDLSLINWPQNDYWEGTIIDVTEDEKEKRLYQSKQLSLSVLYWLQTEAPRDDGGGGYPGLKLRPDVVGTDDGFAKYPYIRESRRIEALETVVEQDINVEYSEYNGVRIRENSVGIGAYRIDLHPTTETNRLFYARSYPFEIPLGSLIPVRIKNLIPACKNIGCTHLTNGCMRVHPVEWNVGESAGALAAFAMEEEKTLHDIYHSSRLTRSFQGKLEQLGIGLHWPEVGEL
ncbi:FAD-dependent oxidoreductase [Halobacillus litoralis]|uniref:FAD-dependent oxidoreductase n=1 Tax=Halobacillus litoralis TaxID=45668 RepID=UPI001CD588DB|nr:FAD-dependent oxidoreductase [Halobacillus litoralis]MCA0970589.1 FAD-dependent oxidoreductase [Halobacillus litoralis]